MAETAYGVYVRWRADEPRLGREFPPFDEDHPLASFPCMGCDDRLANGEPTRLLIVGPGADPEYREKHAAGRWYNATAIPVHTACLGGGAK